MIPPDFEAIEEQFSLIYECLPMGFGSTLPPKFRLRYINLLTEIVEFPKRIKRFQALLSGEKYQKPERLLRAGRTPQQPLADFRKLDDAFLAIKHSLPHKYVDKLPDEYQIPYLRILQHHAHLRAKSLRLEEALKQKGLLESMGPE